MSFVFLKVITDISLVLTLKANNVKYNVTSNFNEANALTLMLSFAFLAPEHNTLLGFTFHSFVSLSLKEQNLVTFQ